ncbi:hypothetical protein [Lewinella sp. 4G2]|uniref:hypothetical protein n=1 Tax=Lewinella sp. 4G2 TaxID=1803372 RepID=UPI0007B4998C|nr:hypothetical protein [Lewinella sp. 4G2]OAV44221.1 hypothetical protein A3850_006810 [Lewinella sp. 4G2]
MTRIFIFLICIIGFLNLNAQDAISSEKNADYLTQRFTSIQTNLRAMEVIHERRIGESSYTMQVVGGISANPIAAFTPLRWFNGTNRTAYLYGGAEGRYYYNLAKRAAKGKITSNNSGGFLGLRVLRRTGYTLFLDADEGDDRNFSARTYVTPRWGMREQLSDHLDLEITAGIDVSVDRASNANGYTVDTGTNITWRIGYRF